MIGLNRTDAFVLRTYKLAEADKIVVLLTRQAGVLRAVARGATKMKSRFGASLELFTLISLDYHEKEGRELVSIRDAEIIHSYFHLTRDAGLVSALDYLSGLLIEFMPPQQPEEKLFRLVTACLRAVEETPAKVLDLTLYFEIWLLKLAGFLPDIRVCATCRRTLGGPTFFGPGNTLQCLSCAQGAGLKLSATAHTFMQDALGMPPSRWLSAVCTATAADLQDVVQMTRLLIARALERPPRGERALQAKR